MIWVTLKNTSSNCSTTEKVHVSSHHHSWQYSITWKHHCTVNTAKENQLLPQSTCCPQINGENKWNKGRNFPQMFDFYLKKETAMELLFHFLIWIMDLICLPSSLPVSIPFLHFIPSILVTVFFIFSGIFKWKPNGMSTCRSLSIAWNISPFLLLFTSIRCTPSIIKKQMSVTAHLLGKEERKEGALNHRAGWHLILKLLYCFPSTSLLG